MCPMAFADWLELEQGWAAGSWGCCTRATLVGQLGLECVGAVGSWGVLHHLVQGPPWFCPDRIAGDGVGVDHRGPGASCARAFWGVGQLQLQWALVRGRSVGYAALELPWQEGWGWSWSWSRHGPGGFLV